MRQKDILREWIALPSWATGLIGRHLLSELLDDAAWSLIHTVGRRPAAGEAERLRQHVVDFASLAPSQLPAAEAIFCCLGTTLRNAGSAEAFRKVDYDYVERLARVGRERGVRRFLLLSSMGADPGARVLYSRTKGEIERAVAAMGYENLEIIRPSFLVGERDEKRPVEAIVTGTLVAISPLLVGSWSKYRPIAARDVARAMISLAKENAAGTRIHLSDELVRRAKAAYSNSPMSPSP